MRVTKLLSVTALVFSVSSHAIAEDAIWVLDISGKIAGLIRSDSGHVYNRDHIFPGDPGFPDNIYEISVTSASIVPRHITTAWLFCLDAKKQRIGGIINDNNQIMGSRLDGNLGGSVLENKIHVGYLCGLPSRSQQPQTPDNTREQAFAEDVAFAEIVLVDHGPPVKGEYDYPPGSGAGERMLGADLQIMSRPEDDPFCNGTYRPRRNCKVIGSGVVPLHRHPDRGQID